MASNPQKPRKSRAKPDARPPADRGQGRGKQFEPTAEQRLLVRNAAAVGLTPRVIAALVINPETQRGISQETLKANFELEMESGGAQAKFNVGKSIYDQAVGVPKVDKKTNKQTGWISAPNTTAAIFYAKTQMGWTERISIDDDTLAAIVAGLNGNLEALRAARASIPDAKG